MSASDDTRPDPGGESGAVELKPSVEELLKVYRALKRFAISRDCSGDYVHEQEDEILSRFTDLADTLRPIRSQFGRFEGWPDWVERDLRRLCDLFDATARRWEWEKFAAPESERIGPIDERQRWFEENRKRSYYGAAIFAESAFDKTDDRWKIRAIANEGRVLGYGPTMTAAELTAAERRALYFDASEAFKRRPYLSDVRPEIGEQYDEYVEAWTDLRAALRPHVPAEIDPRNNPPAPSPDPGTTAPPEAEPAAGSGGTPREDRQPAGADASGSKAPGSRAGRQHRKVPRGELDEQAVALLLKNPTLSYDQLAEALGCRAGTLRDKDKCPKLRNALESIRAQREAFRGGSTWQDRRSDDDDA